MKKNIPTFINELSDNKFEVLEDIFENKFFKFRKLYWALCDYSEYITSLKYNETSSDTLSVKVKCIEDGNTKDVINEITSCINDECITVSKNKNGLTIEIMLDESTAD